MNRYRILRRTCLIIFGMTLFVPSFCRNVPGEESYLNAPCIPDSWSVDRDYWVVSNGDDSGPGTQENPFATINRAIKEATSFAGKESVAIRLKEGKWSIREKILISGVHASREKPIIICGTNDESNGAKSVLSGAVALVDWSSLASSSLFIESSDEFKNRFRSEATDAIWFCSIPQAEELSLSGDTISPGKRAELFADGIPQTLARWPNEQFLHAGEVFGTTHLDSWAGPGCAEGIFEYQEDRLDRWQQEIDPWCFGYWFWDWAESFQKVETIDPEKRQITLTQPWHHYGYKKGFRYYGVNLLCELDAPGEYYIDRENRLLFWYPNQEIDPNTCNTILCGYNQEEMIEIRDSSYIYIAQLDLEFGRRKGIAIRESDHCLLIGLSLFGFGQEAVEITGGNDNGVFGCGMKSLGTGGIAISGGDRKNLVPCNHFVENCRIEQFSRIKRTYAPAISLSGCGMRVASNEIADSSSSALSVAGNDFLIEKNKISRVVRESDDQGGLDVWYNPTYRGVTIRNNYWLDIVGGTHCGAAAVRLDDIISGFTIEGNIFERCGAFLFGAVQIHGGKDNLVKGNLFLDCPAAVSFSAWGERYLSAITGAKESLANESLHAKMYEEVDIRTELWQSKYPELSRIAIEPDVNEVCDNLIVNTENLFLRAPGVEKESNNVLLHIPGATASELIQSGKLQETGIAPIPIEQIGNYPF